MSVEHQLTIQQMLLKHEGLGAIKFDAKLNLNGSLLDARTAEGVMFTSALGNRQFPLTMTR